MSAREKEFYHRAGGRCKGGAVQRMTEPSKAVRETSTL